MWSFVTALGLCTAVWAVVHYTIQVMFSTLKLTRLTHQPYFWLALMLLSMMVECYLLGYNFTTIERILRPSNKKLGLLDCTINNN